MNKIWLLFIQELKLLGLLVLNPCQAPPCSLFFLTEEPAFSSFGSRPLPILSFRFLLTHKPGCIEGHGGI